jgi:uncharacterized membrane protein
VAHVDGRFGVRREGRVDAVRAIGIGLAVVVYVWSWVFLGHWAFARHERSLDQNNDLNVYRDYEQRIRAGQLPYRDFRVVYPPGALPVFLAPGIVPDSSHAPVYKVWFGRFMAVCGVVCLLLVVAAGGSWWAIGFVAISPLAIGSLVVARFDLWPAMLVLAAVMAFVRDRQVLGWTALGVAVVAKLYALVLVPVAIVWTLRRNGARELWRGLAVWLAVVLAVFGPFAILAPHGLYTMLHDQVARLIQIESLPAAILKTFGNPSWTPDLGAISIPGHKTLGNVMAGLEAIVLVGLWIAFARGPMSKDRLIRYTAACVCCFIALGKVLSPQFLIWLVPLVPLVAGLRGLVATALLATALVMTQFYFPGTYVPWLVLTRDLVLVAILVVLAVPALRRRPVPTPAPAHRPRGAVTGQAR